MTDLPIRQRQVLAAYEQAVAAGEPCGAVSLAHRLGISPGGTGSALRQLRTKGLIPERPSGSTLMPDEAPVRPKIVDPPAPPPEVQLAAPADPWALRVLRALQDAEEPLSLLALADALDASPRRIHSALEGLEGQVEEVDGGWQARPDHAPEWDDEPGFTVPRLPSEHPSLAELIQRRKRDAHRKATSERAHKLIDVDITLTGPVGLVHFGDPHVDDDGCDIGALERDIRLVKRTEGLLAGNVGDQTNNWVGRLGQLYGEQSTSAKEAWMLAEWVVKSVPWLYLIKGNHDVWSGYGDPLDWMTENVGVVEGWGARLNLRFPTGKQVRVNARHDFKGSSMWNPAHGPMRAAQQGWRDHILTCGHKHESGYGILKDPATGLISHAIRVAGYKLWDRYAKQQGLPDQNISPSAVTVIDPRFEDDDPRLITVFWDVESAAEYLTWLRGRK